MKFGIFYELQLPKPWGADDERQLVQDALDQVELADRLGLDYAWAVEHHFLEEYSHCSASEVFLAAAAARTKRIRLGHGIRQVIPNYNHPARTAEAVAMLDLVSNGRVDFGIGEGATRLELGGFNIPAKEKRAMSLEAAEQIANMMVMDALSGLRGPVVQDAVPQRPPEARAEAASADVDGLHQPRHHQDRGAASASARWPSPSSTRRRRAPGARSTTTSSRARRACRSATASMPTSPWCRRSRCTHDRAEAARRGQEGFEFFRYAISALVTNDTIPGRSRLFDEFQKQRSGGALGARRGGDGGLVGRIPAIARHRHGRGLPRACALIRGSRSRPDHSAAAGRAATGTSTSASSIELLAREVLPEFKPKAAERDRRKAEELAPYIAKALARKKRMPPLADAIFRSFPRVGGQADRQPVGLTRKLRISGARTCPTPTTSLCTARSPSSQVAPRASALRYPPTWRKRGAAVHRRHDEGPEAAAEHLRSVDIRAAGFRGGRRLGGGSATLLPCRRTEFGGVDILVNNAAIFSTLKRRPFEEIDPADGWRRVMDVNTLGIFLCCRAVLPAFKTRGGGPHHQHFFWRRLQGQSGHGPLRREQGCCGLTYACPCNRTRPLQDLGQQRCARVDAQRWRAGKSRVDGRCARIFGSDPNVGARDDTGNLVGAVAFLAGPDSAFITGQTIVVDGGAYYH